MQWLLVGTSPELRVSVDTLRVRRDSIGKRVWIRFDYAHPRPVPTGTSAKKGAQFVRTETEHYLDCVNERARDIELRVYDAASHQVGDTIWESPRWLAFTRHPLDAYFRLACDGLRVSGK